MQFKTSNFALAPTQRKLFAEAEDKMMAADETILNTKAVKNQLETYCYDMREKCEAGGSLEKNIEPSIKDQFIAELSKTVDWLYEDGENAALEEYTTRLEAFRATGEPIKSRAFYWGELAMYLKQIDPVIAVIRVKLESEDLAHLTEEQRNSVVEKQTATADFLSKVRTDREVKKDFEDPAFTLNEIENQIMALKRETNAIFATPKPAPPAEEKKEDAEMKTDNKEEPKADADMKDEGAAPEAPKK